MKSQDAEWWQLWNIDYAILDLVFHHPILGYISEVCPFKKQENNDETTGQYTIKKRRNIYKDSMVRIANSMTRMIMMISSLLLVFVLFIVQTVNAACNSTLQFFLLPTLNDATCADGSFSHSQFLMKWMNSN